MRFAASLDQFLNCVLNDTDNSTENLFRDAKWQHRLSILELRNG